MAYAGAVKDTFAAQVLAQFDGHARITLAPGDHAWIEAEARRFSEAITEAGYHVVGDLDDIIPGPPGRQVDESTMPSDAELLEVAVAAIAGMLQLTRPTPPPPPAPPTPGRLVHTVRRLSERHPPVMAARKFYRKAKRWKDQAQRR
jgi:hypothetical protein